MGLLGFKLLPQTVLNERAFTLVETVISMGVASLIFIGTTAVVLDNAKQKRRSDAGVEKLSLDQDIRTILRTRGICTKNVQGLVVNETDFTDFNPARGKIVAGSSNWSKGANLLSSSSGNPAGYLSFANVLVSQPKVRVIARSNPTVLMLELTYTSGVSNGKQKLGQALNRSSITFWVRGTPTGANWTVNECYAQAVEGGELTGSELCDRLDTGRHRYAYDAVSGTCESVSRAFIGAPGGIGNVPCPAGWRRDGVDPDDTGFIETGIALIDGSIPGCLTKATKIAGVPGCESPWMAGGTAGAVGGDPVYMTVNSGFTLPNADQYIRVRCIPGGVKRLDE